MGRLAITLSAFALAVAQAASAGAASPVPEQHSSPTPLSAAQQHYLALAQAGVTQAKIMSREVGPKSGPN